MKSKYVVLASALLISVATFAQKDQIKAAEKALKGGKSQEAATILAEAESLLSGASETEKAQFFFLKGNASLDLATKKVNADKNLEKNQYKMCLGTKSNTLGNFRLLKEKYFIKNNFMGFVGRVKEVIAN